jgi:hypothetical protein
MRKEGTMRTEAKTRPVHFNRDRLVLSGLALATALALGAPSAQAANYYVSTAGNNAYNGLAAA